MALEYVISGKETCRRQIPMLDVGDYGEHFYSPIVNLLPAPSALDDPGRRLVEVLVRFAQYYELGKWLGPLMTSSQCEQDCQSILVAAFSQAGREGSAITQGNSEYIEALKAWPVQPHRSAAVLKAVVEKGGAEAAPLLLAALELPLPELRLPGCLAVPTACSAGSPRVGRSG
jgi:hypothetical protein